MAGSRVKRFDGVRWNDLLNVKKYNGSSWVDAQAYFWDGNSWEPMIDRSPGTTTRTAEWSSSWCATYNGSGSRIRTDSGYQGYYSSNNGNQKAMFGFTALDGMQRTLAGATINLVKLDFVVSHTYASSGTTFQFGTHNYTGSSSPGTYSSVLKALTTYTASVGQINNLTLSNTIGTQIRDKLAAGIVLETSNTGNNYYGAISSMTLRITYTK